MSDLQKQALFALRSFYSFIVEQPDMYTRWSIKNDEDVAKFIAEVWDDGGQMTSKERRELLEAMQENA